MNEIAIDVEIVIDHVAGLTCDGDGLLLHTIETAVAHGDVLHIDGGVESDDKDAVVAPVAGHVFHRHVAHQRIEASKASLTGLIVEVDLQHSLTALSYLDVAHVDVLNDAASAIVGLDAQYALEIGRVHHAILGEDILTASGNLRSDDHGPMSVLHLAVADDDISGGFLPKTAVVVASALDGDAVVTGVERAVFDDNVLAGFRIAAVAVGPFVPYLHIVDGDAF